ncbi:unnamed protein product [Ostreobium quekettii]|uniref:CBM20 domain-containing protein n=1 Tax=Ostreobium quekettii TaxID=121088 RepID=A0A8S1JFF6_9CHLO|nr:unnamed protein product [Ostreobium quekettii]|eukprot:evm.model.scf_52.13 EVM.evm.TU.scf_52.13   scf_52:119228-124185(-)
MVPLQARTRRPRRGPPVRAVLGADFCGRGRRAVGRRRAAEEAGAAAIRGDGKGPQRLRQRPRRPQSPLYGDAPEVQAPGPEGDGLATSTETETPEDRHTAPGNDQETLRPVQAASSASMVPRSGGASLAARRREAASSLIGRNADLVNVRFTIQFHVEYGQWLRVVGSHQSLGDWSILDGVDLAWSEGDLWHVSLQLPAGNVYEYKYAVMGQNGQACMWQRGNNSVLAVGMAKDDIDVFDNWEGHPGASVISGGNVTTREKCLLQWATEIESHLVSSASSLQKITLKLQEAQEAAQVARQESARLRAELRVESVARRAAEQQVRELELLNRQLKAQLQEQHLLSRQVMKDALRLLTEALEKKDMEPVSEGLDVQASRKPGTKTKHESSIAPMAKSSSIPPPSLEFSVKAEPKIAEGRKDTLQKEGSVKMGKGSGKPPSNGGVGARKKMTNTKGLVDSKTKAGNGVVQA